MRVRIMGASKAAHQTYIGPEGSLSIVTETKALRLHDGATPGGFPASGVPEPDAPPGTILGFQDGQWVPIEVSEIPLMVGPGPQDLVAGDAYAGFFGEVSSAELFGGNELSMAVGTSTGTLIEDDPGWLKFAYKGRVLYYAKRPIRSDITWSGLYFAGCVYGINGYGAIPMEGIPVNQLRVIEKDGVSFIVRLPRSLSIPAFGTTQFSGFDLPIAHGSEWNELMYRVSSFNPESQVGPNWAEFSADELGLALESLCRERSSVSSIYVIAMGGNLRVDRMVASQRVDAGSHWRPVLELFDPLSILLEPTNVTYRSDFLRPIGGVEGISADILPIQKVHYRTQALFPIGQVDVTAIDE